VISITRHFRYLLFILVLIQRLSGEVLFDPPGIQLPDAVSGGEAFTAELTISNPESSPLVIDFISSQEHWSVTPSRIDLKPGESAVLVIRGILDLPVEPVSLLMISDRDDVPYLYLLSPSAVSVDSSRQKENSFVFFYSPGCGFCTEFYETFLPKLEKETGLVLNPEKLNVFEPGNYEYLSTLAAQRGRNISSFPVLIMGDRIFSGEKEIETEFPEYVRSPDLPDGSASTLPEVSPTTGEGGLPDLRWLPVFLAGLLDGINPCAFTSLIFLISYLRLMGKKGTDILKIGGSFTLAVFLTYFLVGLGAFQFIRMAESFTLISQVIRIVLGGGLFVLAVLSLVDYIRIRQGRESESILQLSLESKKRIHRVVRSSSRSALLYLSSFTAGFLISLYELGCTGQIYLPMLVYMVKQENWNALAPLALYNGAFILPLIVVFALFYKGSDSVKFSEIFQRNMGKIKLITAVLFLVMGVFILFF